jgi:hypothetical protein
LHWIRQSVSLEHTCRTASTLGTGILLGTIRWFPWQLVLIGGTVLVVCGALGEFYFAFRANRQSARV